MAAPASRLTLTLAASVAVFAAFVLATHRLTGGFAWWTLEAARRARADSGALRAPALPLRNHRGMPLVAWGEGRTACPRVQVVDFIYTRCLTVCAALGTAFQQMQAELAQAPGGEPDIHLLSLSIDPAHDDADSLAGYARLHRADASLWTVAAPATGTGVGLLRRHWGVVAIPDGLGGFVHNGSLHVVDAGGAVRGIYDHADWRLALARAHQLAGHP